MNYYIVRSTIGLIGGTLIAVALMLSCSVHPDTIQWVTYVLSPILTVLMATDIARLTFHSIDDKESTEGASRAQLESKKRKIFSCRTFSWVVRGTIGLSILAVGFYLLVRPRVDQMVTS